MPNLVVLVETVWASVGGPKVFGVLWPRPLNWVRGCPLANSPLLHVGYKLPNFVKRHECIMVFHWKNGLSRPEFQGHSRSSELAQIER